MALTGGHVGLVDRQVDSVRCRSEPLALDREARGVSGRDGVAGATVAAAAARRSTAAWSRWGSVGHGEGTRRRGVSSRTQHGAPQR